MQKKATLGIAYLAPSAATTIYSLGSLVFAATGQNLGVCPAKLFLEANKDDPRVKDPYAHYLDLDIMEDEEDEEWKADSYRVVFCFDN
jgi:hypothetical protein